MPAQGPPAKWWYTYRGLLMVPPVVLCLAVTAGEFEEDVLVWGVGGTLFVAGLLIRIWAQMHLHYRLLVHKVLTMTGPYARVRNPIYIGNTLMLVGCTVASEMVWAAPLVLAYCLLLYRHVVRYEESHLAAKYGPAYASYRERVPRWLPKLRVPTPSRVTVRRYFVPSLRVELHNIILVLLFVAKEFVGR
jgi:protein-S-isoprenylcysteine O-methyltransferase Ste14